MFFFVTFTQTIFEGVSLPFLPTIFHSIDSQVSISAGRANAAASGCVVGCACPDEKRADDQPGSPRPAGGWPVRGWPLAEWATRLRGRFWASIPRNCTLYELLPFCILSVRLSLSTRNQCFQSGNAEFPEEMFWFCKRYEPEVQNSLNKCSDFIDIMTFNH